jgi:hypothetical protein
MGNIGMTVLVKKFFGIGKNRRYRQNITGKGELGKQKHVPCSGIKKRFAKGNTFASV